MPEEFMKHVTPPEVVAQSILDGEFTKEVYEELQTQRRSRLKTFEKYGIQVLVENEKELIAYGEKVLAIVNLNQHGKNITS